MSTTFSPPIAAPKRSRSLVRVIFIVLIAFVAYESVRVFFGTNRHTVVPGRVYRCAQPTEADVRDLVREKNIRTILNLRGAAVSLEDPRNAWYKAEVVASHELAISQEDITLSAKQLPPPAELHRLVDVLDHTEYPILIHCKQGADRTGLVSAMYLLLFTESTLQDARRELWPTRGHIGIGPTAPMDEFFDRYETWLDARSHTPELFRDWVLHVYTPGCARSEMHWLDPITEIAHDRSLAARVRIFNRSTEPWVFKPGDYSGIHLQYVVANVPANQKPVNVYYGTAGLFHAIVQPGESIDLTVALPPLHSPGKYVMSAELIDGIAASVPVRQNSFVKFGDESIMAEFQVK